MSQGKREKNAELNVFYYKFSNFQFQLAEYAYVLTISKYLVFWTYDSRMFVHVDVMYTECLNDFNKEHLLNWLVIIKAD